MRWPTNNITKSLAMEESHRKVTHRPNGKGQQKGHAPREEQKQGTAPHNERKGGASRKDPQHPRRLYYAHQPRAGNDEA